MMSLNVLQIAERQLSGQYAGFDYRGEAAVENTEIQ